MKEWLTIDEVAALLGCARSTAYRKMNRAIASKYDVSTGKHLYHARSIAQIVRKRPRGNPRFAWDSDFQRANARARWEKKRRETRASNLPLDKMPNRD